jgi:hypothetical protein
MAAPQRVQLRASDAPHSTQNFAVGGLSCRQRGHFMLQPRINGWDFVLIGVHRRLKNRES